MAAVKKSPGTISCWGRDREWVRIQWDFAVDGGAVGQLDLFTAAHGMIIESAKIISQTTVTTSASGTISVGKTGDLTGLVTATAATNLEAGEVAFGAAQDASHVLVAGDIVKMDIATGALTAGKVDFLFEIQKV